MMNKTQLQSNQICKADFKLSLPHLHKIDFLFQSTLVDRHESLFI